MKEKLEKSIELIKKLEIEIYSAKMDSELDRNSFE
jgi:hypothetical protein